MPSYTVSIAAASAPLDTDLFANERWKEQPNNRFISGLGCRGSAAAGDTEIEIFVGETRILSLFNNNTGFPDNDDMIPQQIPVPAGEEISAIVVDAPTTNPINVRVDFVDV
jgi:hypothetical protein